MVLICRIALTVEVFSHDGEFNRAPFFHFEAISKCGLVQLQNPKEEFEKTEKKKKKKKTKTKTKNKNMAKTQVHSYI